MCKRASTAYFALILFFGVLTVNIFLICLNIDSRPAAGTGSTRRIEIAESRGNIYDRNMKKLVNSSQSTVAVCLPTAEALSLITPFISESERAEVYENISLGTASVVKTDIIFNEPEVKTATVISRYSENQLCANLIGHLDENGKGAMGLEKVYDNYLSMQSGSLSAEWSVDALGHILSGGGIEINNESYTPAGGIQLTIDIDIQRIAEEALKDFNIEKGAAVILDAGTGEILAAASVPAFNPLDLASALKDENSPFVNRAISAYSVGSVFKPFVAAAAIEQRVEISFECSGSIDVGGTVFKCSASRAHGKVDITKAMEKSCNSFFIALGQEMGSESILRLCSALGFGRQNELADGFYSAAGSLPESGDITSPQDLANLSFGQGKLTATPVQLVAAYACFANGGIYREPTLMKAIIDKNINAVQKVSLPEGYRVFSESTAAELDRILESVVKNGNAEKAYSDITVNHGKTATAQSGWYENGREINHTWFCGYFTVSGKTYSVAVLKEDGISGASDCAPVFRQISKDIAQIS